ncbi:hypothetical protein [Rhodococcoides fascians]|uniref:hypothetical protein n=1 Tax=Rhodococcoides fascians TaxID=1828 RepID=UPI00068EA373|nr:MULTISPECIES: hypothetical protein [Rhodococcus]OZE97399.1 hypothetical protein CH301_17685 [Rhodococcus sp. 15-1189-1-1a]OZF12091.1 hypothetical protein CH299_18375 [Rhodococcus sp. 14-2686-1-2]
MTRVRIYAGAACGLAAVVMSGCSTQSSGNATAPLATVNTDPPSVVRTTTPSAATTPPSTPVPTTPAPTTRLPSTTISTAAPAIADPSRYEGLSGFYYFISPTGKFECAVFITDASVAGCHGEFPSNAPRVEGSGAPDSLVAPNTVELTAGTAARFLSSGDPRFHRFDAIATPLPYGETLSIPGSGTSNGITCRVDELAGVSCVDQVGHGFTVSDTAFELK